jgi:DNA repair exonuclease SbcCD ATPase subunit
MADLTVDERQSNERSVDWLSAQADDAVKLYLADKRAEQNVALSLRAAWDIRATLVKAVEERTKLASEQSELQKATEETRRNLKALEKNRTAADLRDQLTTRLAKNSLRLEEITKRLVEVDMRVNEQRVRFTDMIRSIKLTNPPKPE